MKNTIKTISCGLFLFITLSACDQKQPLEPLTQQSRILAFGDSLTFGTGAIQDSSYPAILRQQLNLEVINAGVPGEISGEGRARLPAVLEEHEPDLVILCHGGNDLLRKFSHNQIKTNLANMIETIQATGADILLIAVPEPNIMLTAPDFYQELADTYQLNIETEALADILGDRSLKADPIHPNAKGYQLLANALLDKLQTTQALTLLAD